MRRAVGLVLAAALLNGVAMRAALACERAERGEVAAATAPAPPAAHGHHDHGAMASHMGAEAPATPAAPLAPLAAPDGAPRPSNHKGEPPCALMSVCALSMLSAVPVAAAPRTEIVRAPAPVAQDAPASRAEPPDPPPPRR